MAKALVLTVKQAAAELGVSERTVRKRVDNEQLKYKMGDDGRLKIPLSAIKKLIDPGRYEILKERLTNGETIFPPGDNKTANESKESKPTKPTKPVCKATKKGKKK